ncbi:MAG: chemotaxis protein CheB [Candidatus Omnitrophica bacterium]|nr:chemotaxis protein CheB [Candidatus Omnitrophota bacterium]
MVKRIKITKSFPIVGIGASAGGLEAFQELLKNLSAKPQMAFVFIMHLAPEHKSMLTELLARLTKIPVKEIKNGMFIEINHLYVIPPNANISISGGKLMLSRRADRDFKHMPIDYFFRSLAEDKGNKSIGVILSGTATDGTLGSEAIKSAEGIVLAQDEKSAKYFDMPRSAINAKCVDFISSPKKIAAELERMARHPYLSHTWPVKTEESLIIKDEGLDSVFNLLHLVKGLDFTYYKAPTISRRVSRRMILVRIEKLKEYIKFLRKHKDEVEKLYEDLLINVSSFFRDPKAFHTLEKLVIPAIIKNKTKDQSIRVWVPGCSTGEEAYSIAMCFIEAMGDRINRFPIRIFATDVNESGINKARCGIYGKSIENNVTPQRLKKFFIKTGNFYKVSKQLREVCIFSKQNVFSDPPFSNLDLISCRNLLIYFQPFLQKKVFYNFHYGLRPGGFLFLGNSESAGGYANLFKILDRKQRIFVKKYLLASPEPELDRSYHPSDKLGIKLKPDIKKSKKIDIENIVEQVVLREYVPCGALIDNDMEVISFRGHTGRYLESAAGKPSLNIFKLAREGLFFPLHSAIQEAKKTKHTVKREAQEVRLGSRKARVNITVVPVKLEALKEKLFLVLFDEIGRPIGGKSLVKVNKDLSLKSKSIKSDRYINGLQKELAETKEYLQTIIEEQESANEEVKTANEEILSSNEELQSTNEELETAKEELQSSNEELITSNEELQRRNKEVSLLNNDLVNLLNSINMPVIMMGVDFVVRRITPQSEKALNITPADIGRPISSIKLNFDIPEFKKILVEVIESLHPKEFEIADKRGNWYSVYIKPYRTLDDKIDGVVVIFVNITERKKAEQIIEEARIYAENIIESMVEPLIVLGDDLKLISANKSFYQVFKINAKEAQGQPIYHLDNRQWDIPALRHLLENILPNKGSIENFEVKHNFKTIGSRTMFLNVRRLSNIHRIIITIDDITERRRLENELAQANEREYRTLIENLPQKVFLKDKNSVYVSCNGNYARDLRIKPEEIVGKTDFDFFPTYLAEKYRADDKKVMESGKTENIEEEFVFINDFLGDSQKSVVNTVKVPVQDKTGNIVGIFGLYWDITERKRAEEKLHTSQQMFESIVNGITDGVLLLAVDLKVIWSNNASLEHFGLTREEVQGQHCYNIIHRQQRRCQSSANYECPIRDVLKKGNSKTVIHAHINKNGEPSFIEVTVFPIKNKDGEVVQLLHFQRDITERKRNEDELRRIEDLKTFTEMRLHFTSMVSHELRSPLGVIKEGINLVLEGLVGDVNSEQKDLLGTAKRNVDRLSRLINNVLDFQKIEMGRVKFDISQNDIKEVVLETINAMGVLVKEKNLDLIIEADDNIPRIGFDRDRIVQVVTNLLNNAIASTDKGKIVVSIKQETNVVHVMVQDTGLGIKDEDMKKLFWLLNN